MWFCKNNELRIDINPLIKDHFVSLLFVFNILLQTKAVPKLTCNLSCTPMQWVSGMNIGNCTINNMF